MATCFGGTTARGFGGTTVRGFGDTTVRGFGSARTRAFELSTALSTIANRSRLESFAGERGDWLWDTIEEGLGTYLYRFSKDMMRMDSRLYGICMKENPITTGLCVNIHRKNVEE